MIRSTLTKLLIFPPMILAIAIVWAAQNRPTADAQAAEEQAVAAAVMTIQPVILSGSVSGFGRVEPTKTWSGVAEVEGRLIEFSDELQTGVLVEAGQTLFVIDPRDYEIAVSQAQAEVRRSEADLRSLQVNAENSRQSLAIERDILEIFEEDRNRTQALVERGSLAASQLDDVNRTFFSQQSVVASLEATLALVEPDTLSAEASLERAIADLESAERNQARTRVTAPFDARVTDRGANEGQFVRTGDVPIMLETTASSEVTAAMQPAELARLFGTLATPELLQQAQAESGTNGATQAVARLLKATVIADYGGGIVARWPAQITRVTGNIEADTGTIGVVVRVDGAGVPDPTADRPALVNGSFVEVLLEGPQVRDQIAVPESALRYDGPTPYLLIANSDNRLERREVVLGPVIGEQNLITEGIAVGERVVLSDPRPAAEGLLLDPIERDVAR